MVLRLNATSSGFAEAFDEFVAARRGVEEDVDDAVAQILADVRRRGDEAVIEHTERFDNQTLTAATMRVATDEAAAAAARCSDEARSALAAAARRIAAFHERQRPEDDFYTDSDGVRLGARWTPIQAVGLYVPGGTASYPSSVLMNAVPARVAGVARLVMTVPTPDGVLNPLVMEAARLAEVDEIYRIGGAQAVAALAYGTSTIVAVDKIVGPGNAYVAAAKRRVYGTVGIDMVAGPSEILVVADAANDPSWIAIDLLSQAEHDPVAQAILITDDPTYAEMVANAVESHLATLPRGSVAAASWRDHSAIIVVESIGDASPLVDALAPEHLELAVANPEELAARVKNAGAIFLGRYTPEAIGDYIAGPNHVLPTARSARFSSGLGVLDFMKRTTFVGCDRDGLTAIGPAAVALAEAEGLDAHARSIAIRLGQTNDD
jgi:histidinol dehydrogenase